MKLKWGLQGPPEYFPWSIGLVRGFKFEIIGQHVKLNVRRQSVSLSFDAMGMQFLTHYPDGACVDAVAPNDERDEFDLKRSRKIALKRFVSERDPDMSAFLEQVEDTFGLHSVTVQIHDETFESGAML